MFIYGDHVGTWGLYHQVLYCTVLCCAVLYCAVLYCTVLNPQLRVMEDCGFQDIDVAWRHQAFFVAGGRRAMETLH